MYYQQQYGAVDPWMQPQQQQQQQKPGLFAGLLNLIGVGPGNSGVPQIDSSFMSQPMATSQPMPDMLGPQQSSDPREMLMLLLQKQMQQWG